MNIKKWGVIAAMGAAVLFTSVACGSNTPAATSGGSSAPASAAAGGSDMSSSAPMSSGAMSSGAMSSGAMSSGAMSSGAMSSGAMSGGSEAGATLVGAGCAGYAKANPTGAGSVDGMATAKVAEAASANPLLKTLVAAVSGKVNPDVNLVDTLDGGQFTVFAPVDDAFKKVDAATMKTLTTDKALLTKILTYHVIQGQIAPDKIVGTHKTVEGQDLTVTGSGNDLKVNGTSTVICGGVKTANATVYLIDTVLSPPAATAGSSSAAMSSDMGSSMAPTS
ncbi:MAG: fasciclin domain-containing protein [Nakamurella sp.]